MPYRSLVLPFIVEGEGGESPFASDLELAAIVCLAEAQRKKGGLLSASAEKVAFISKVYYPLWLVPWEERCLVVDGLGLSSYRAEYARLPDLNLFIEDLKRSGVVSRDFRKTLERHSETFRNFEAFADVSVNGLITRKGLLDAFVKYFGRGSFIEEGFNEDSALIPPELGEDDALEAGRKVINLWRLIRADWRGLEQALNVLYERVEFHERGINCEIERIREEYERKASDLRPVIEEKLKRLAQKRDAEVRKVEKATEKKLKSAMKKKGRCERRLQRLERNEIFILKRIEHFKRKGKDAKVDYWNSKLRECRREIEKAEREIKAVSDQIEAITREGEEKVKEVEKRFQEMISQEESKIKELEALCDSEIKAKQKELKELKSMAEQIAEDIKELIEKKKEHASSLRGETSIPLKQDETVLAHVPLYMVKYEGEEGKVRYSLHPPMLASSHNSLLKKIRKVWSFSLEGRIKLLISPFSKDLEKMLNSALIERMGKDEVFREKIDKVCCSNNLLARGDFGRLLTDGVNQLKRRELVKMEEAMTILEHYGGAKAD